jgi:blue copper oxidase
MRNILFVILIVLSHFVQAQNPLAIPPTLTGTTFNLNVQSGTKMFYGTTATPTYGINGVWLSPTIIVNKGDNVTLNVINNLTIKTTMHWHGLHVAAMNDGGPHQIINAGATWSPSFEIKNNAGTFWYHPHGAGQTDPQVSKGLAGLFIVHDASELALNIPHTYGTDDIPLIVQSKAFDILQQIAIATDMDTAIFVNGTLNPYFNAPAQVIRFRLLNGSSLRSYNFGFSNNQTFYQIATDGGLIDTAVTLTRLRLSPGERAEILVNFSGMTGQSIFLKSFASELTKGIYGADTVGFGMDTIHEYNDNFLNGVDFDLLKLTITAPTLGAVTTIVHNLVPYTPFNVASATNTRKIVFDTIRLLAGFPPNLAEGPFGMNQKTFDMDSINEIVYLNTTEIWTLQNKTLVAHPFHIHDIQFNVIEKNGQPPLPSETGWKDVILVMPHDSVKFITKFDDFADNTTPYMYHCHLLHHEDDGMMGSFLVIDTTNIGLEHIVASSEIKVFQNPVEELLMVNYESLIGNVIEIEVLDIIGEKVVQQKNVNPKSEIIDIQSLPNGMYILRGITNKNTYSTKFIKQ